MSDDVVSPATNKRKAEDEAPGAPDTKLAAESAQDAGTSNVDVETPTKRGPGRPRKNPAAPTVPLADGEAPLKRKRGRPPRPRTEEELAAMAAKAALPKRPRGRPRKIRPEDGQAQAAAASGSAVLVPAAAAPIPVTGAAPTASSVPTS